MFDNKIFNEFNEFRKQIESKIQISSTTYNGEYNRFKKCPHCGLIWFKVKGCNTVQCGKRTKATDKIVGRYKNYIVTYEDNKVIIKSEDLGSDKDLENMMNQNMMMNNNGMMNSQNMMMNNNGMMNSQNMMMNNNPMMNSLNMMMNNNPMMNSQNMMMDNNPMMNSLNMMMNNNPMMNNMGMMGNNMNNNNMGNQNMNQMQMGQMMQQMMMQNSMIQNDDEFIGLTQKEINENIKREEKGMTKINPLGCGMQLNWNEMEDCSDEVIAKLKEISVDDYHAGLYKISEEMKNN